MKNGIRFLGCLLSLASLVSCGSGSASERSLSSYSETGAEDLGTQIVCQVSDAYSSAAFSSVEVTANWVFGGLPLFFGSACPLSRDSILSLAASYVLSTTAEDSSYSCQGTSFLCYTARRSVAGTKETFATDKTAGDKLAICYVAKLKKHTFAKTHDATNSFAVYAALEAPYLDCRAV